MWGTLKIYPDHLSVTIFAEFANNFPRIDEISPLKTNQISSKQEGLSPDIIQVIWKKYLKEICYYTTHFFTM